jgi:hypothetical protein
VLAVIVVVLTMVIRGDAVVERGAASRFIPNGNWDNCWWSTVARPYAVRFARHLRSGPASVRYSKNPRVLPWRRSLAACYVKLLHNKRYFYHYNTFITFGHRVVIVTMLLAKRPSCKTPWLSGPPLPIKTR